MIYYCSILGPRAGPAAAVHLSVPHLSVPYSSCALNVHLSVAPSAQLECGTLKCTVEAPPAGRARADPAAESGNLHLLLAARDAPFAPMQAR
jgi:hypothetical protein